MRAQGAGPRCWSSSKLLSESLRESAQSCALLLSILKPCQSPLPTLLSGMPLLLDSGGPLGIAVSSCCCSNPCQRR